MSTLQLDPHRALPFLAEQRSIAWQIYSETKDLPLICMHGHVELECLPTTRRSQILRSC
jgi:glucuronate isomerase